MPKPPPDRQLADIESVLARHTTNMSISEIEAALTYGLPRRTLQSHLKQLVDQGRVLKEGERRWTTYRLVPSASERLLTSRAGEEADATPIDLSSRAIEIVDYVRQPVAAREPVGYNHDFLESYRPNKNFYLSEAERVHLEAIGQSEQARQPAGTFAREILNRLLIDLSWNSSRLEGNTYSLLDTKRLLDFGHEAEGHDKIEAQMILNHKDAIEFLVESVDEVGFNRYTLLNLHALLANNLLADPDATGRLRKIVVGIEKSVFRPLEIPQLVEEYFDQIIATANAIDNPFEQALFALVQLPYLQPFDDVNKRVSRLASNIPLIRHNLIPLSFIDVSAKTYTEAILGVYELNKVDLMKDVFIWAYERSVSQYRAVRQSLGEPDPFRLKYRAELSELIQQIVTECLTKSRAFNEVRSWTDNNVSLDVGDKAEFRATVEAELLALHEGNIARYRIKPAQFSEWRKVWEG